MDLPVRAYCCMKRQTVVTVVDVVCAQMACVEKEKGEPIAALQDDAAHYLFKAMQRCSHNSMWHYLLVDKSVRVRVCMCKRARNIDMGHHKMNSAGFAQPLISPCAIISYSWAQKKWKWENDKKKTQKSRCSNAWHALPLLNELMGPYLRIDERPTTALMRRNVISSEEVTTNVCDLPVMLWYVCISILKWPLSITDTMSVSIGAKHIYRIG